jgi:Sulfate permease family
MSDVSDRSSGTARLLDVFPPSRWLAKYKSARLPHDLIAGVTLAAYAIPVSLAYAGLAGLPPEVGVYGYLLGGLGYALLGSSRQLAIGPTSAISLVIAGTVRADREPRRLHGGVALPDCLAVAAERAGEADRRQHPRGLQGGCRTDHRESSGRVAGCATCCAPRGSLTRRAASIAS